MTTDEALSIVDQVGAGVQMNRQGHYTFQEAVATLRVALSALPLPEENQGEPDTGGASHDGAKPVPAES